MTKYILKRILIFLPTLFAISLIAFWLSKIAPGDPVLACAANPEDEITSDTYQKIYESMGLDKPLFYLELSTAAYPDTFYRIPGRYHKETLSKFIDQYGNWDQIQAYNTKLEKFHRAIKDLPKGVDKNQKIKVRRAAGMLLEAHQDIVIKSHFKAIEENLFGDNKDSLMHVHIGALGREMMQGYRDFTENPSKGKLYMPSIKWQGSDNQYHHWVTAFFKGDFGISCRSGQPVLNRIRTPILWTLRINIIVIFIIYILAVPLGMFSAVNKDSKGDKTISVFLFALYSLPTFWIATMLLVFFTNSEYGMDWFEGAGLGSLPSSAPFWDRFWETTGHLILPIFCMTYGSLAFMSRQMRGGMLDVLNQDYIRTAKAKGLSRQKVVWKHALRNALFPLITLFALVFPGAVGGSVIIEVIFNIPGMGREVVDAIGSKDWPVLYTILMLVAILTMVGNLVADILYAVVDPRVTFK